MKKPPPDATKQPKPDKARRNRIEEEWNHFKSTTGVPKDTPRHVIENTRKVFYAGAHAMGDIVIATTDTKDWLLISEALDELTDFRNDINRRAAALKAQAQNSNGAKV